MSKYQKPAVVLILMMIFFTWFLHNTKRDFPLIFKKDLLAHDESSNSVVAANVTRKFFPPMVRTNPLVEEQGNWMEGPFWQHIPPLFAYVPDIFFKLDGQVTIEVKRLSYAFVILLTGLLFIFGVYKFRKSLLAALAATIAAIFWICSPFTHELITGYAFGVSDIVLAFTVMVSFCGVLWYVGEVREVEGGQGDNSNWKAVIISLMVALPILAKNLLGAIPAATFFVLLLWDHKRISKKVLISLAAFFGLLTLYYIPLYFASPITFKSEIFVSFSHFSKLEGWARPWYWYVTNYLPQRYLLGWSAVYFLGLGVGVVGWVMGVGERRDKILLALSGGWFFWNLIAISLVTSKVPNFIYQTFLLSIFFVIYSLCLLAKRFWSRSNLDQKANTAILSRIAVLGAVFVLVVSVIVTGYESYVFIRQMRITRAQAYTYSSEHEKFYQTAEELRVLGANTKDLIIVRVSDNDCWFRYYPLFLTGTESKTLLEMYFGYSAHDIKSKYNRMFFVTNKNDRIASNDAIYLDLTNYSVYEFNLSKMSGGSINDNIANFIADHNGENSDIQKDILRIKKDKTSCQWLVPDPILNAP